jgi:photosystem II stability/assembly factor-like uncharacterized protein
VSVVDEFVVWVSGLEGTYARTVDGGSTWIAAVVPGAESLQFRDIHAVDANTAYLLSAGLGEQSRIYKTVDGGQNWALQFVNPQVQGFFDCMDFWDPNTGVAFSDAVDGQFVIMRTEDGEQWQRVPPEDVPEAQPGEGSFAASGTCVTTHGNDMGWIGTGAAAIARILRTTDRGRTWTVHLTPIVAGPSAGITSVAFRDANIGVIAGGVIDRPEDWTDNVAITKDGGLTWELGGRPSFAGAVYGAVYAASETKSLLVAVGPKGASYSEDDGMSWSALDTLNYWGIGFAGPEAGWLSGPDGRIVNAILTKDEAP